MKPEQVFLKELKPMRTYTPRIVLVKSGRKTRSAIAISKLMSNGLSFAEAEHQVKKELIETGKIRG